MPFAMVIHVAVIQHYNVHVPSTILKTGMTITTTIVTTTINTSNNITLQMSVKTTLVTIESKVVF